MVGKSTPTEMRWAVRVDHPDPAPTRLEVRALSKTFASVRVLHEVDLVVRPGEIHGLAGQNGCGKSTLIKVLAGIHRPDRGTECRVDGKRLRLPVRPRDARAAGLSIVHQDLGVLDEFSVAENLCIQGSPVLPLTRRIDRSARDRQVAGDLARLGLAFDPAAPVAALSTVQRAELVIARAIRGTAAGSGLLVLDEATRAMAGEELARVHALLRRIVDGGGAVLMVSHSLPELLEHTDRITVLRDGRVVGAGLPTRDLDEPGLARAVLGTAPGRLGAGAGPRRNGGPTGARDSRQGSPVEVSGLVGGGVDHLGFTVAAGEVLGVTGMPGGGYEGIPRWLSGATAPEAGTLRVGSVRLDLASAKVSDFLRAGVVMVPERRERDGLASQLTVSDNLCLPSLTGSRRWFVGSAWRRAQCDAAVRRLDIRPASPGRLPAGQLSGGNQQKVLVAKWLTVYPMLLILHEPTQGVDVGARRDILTAVRDSAAAGAAVLLVSGEIPDLSAVCDRVLVLRDSTTLVRTASTEAAAITRELRSATG